MDIDKMLVTERRAQIIGSIVSIFGIIGAASYLCLFVGRTPGLAFWPIVLMYLTGTFVQFWMYKYYEGGLSALELVRLLVWPWHLFRDYRAGVRPDKVTPTLKRINDPTDSSAKVLKSAKASRWAGVVGTVLTVALAIILVDSLTWGRVGSLLFMLLMVHLFGMSVRFLTDAIYKNGITAGKLLVWALWEGQVISSIRAGGRLRSSKS